MRAAAAITGRRRPPLTYARRNVATLLILQDRLNGTLLTATDAPDAGWLEAEPGASLEQAGRRWIVRHRATQESPPALLLLVDRVQESATGMPLLVDRSEDADPLGPSTFHLSGDGAGAGPFLVELGQVIEARKQSTGARSYTRALFDGGAPKISAKIREEAEEFGRALTAESDDRVANEAADVLFHLLVGLSSRGLGLRHVVTVLARRFGISGHVEKATRPPPAP